MFFPLYLCLFSMQSQISQYDLHLERYASVKYAKAEGEKNIPSNAACSCLESLHACNHFLTAVSSFICWFLFSSVLSNIKHFRDHEISVIT